jgi:hypothetical protein
MVHLIENVRLSHNVYCEKNSTTYTIMKLLFGMVAVAAFVVGTISIMVIIAVMVGAA